jgi:NADH:ubiquinone oxidoreductase subunit 5 (subunit L)/multisubunit Na+/H+ antiporter MnhA subunit
VCIIGLLVGALSASFYFLVMGDVFIEWEVLSVGSSNILFVLIFDFMSMLFVFTVSLVSCGVMVFRGRYMAGEKYYRRFIMIVIRFIISMFLLILRPNLIRILLG